MVNGREKRLYFTYPNYTQPVGPQGNPVPVLRQGVHQDEELAFVETKPVRYEQSYRIPLSVAIHSQTRTNCVMPRFLTPLCETRVLLCDSEKKGSEEGKREKPTNRTRKSKGKQK